VSIETTNPFPRRFVFHGNAVAADVFVTKVNGVKQTIYHLIDGQSSLAVIGGISENEVPEPRFEPPLSEVFFYRGARTSAKGVFEGDNAVTTVHASVRDVRVTNREKAGSPDLVFRAGEVSLTVRSTYAVDNSKQPSFDYMEVPVFRDLSLDGQKIELEFNDELMGCTTWHELQKRYKTHRPFFDSLLFGRHKTASPLNFGDDIPYSPGSYAICSFVRSIKIGDRTIPGHVLQLHGFGSIYFGEVILNDRERRVTMVRTQLGCNHAGGSAMAETDPNGTQVPPDPPPNNG